MSSLGTGKPPVAGHADVSPISDRIDCRTCGACCSYSSDWPRFTLETDATIDRIPSEFVNSAQSGIRCEGGRCSALSGKVGEATSCRIYAMRPDVCRHCEPGDEACSIARAAFQLADLAD